MSPTVADAVTLADPDLVQAYATDLQSRARTLRSVGLAMRELSTPGWSGHAADRFRERFEAEPRRWHEAADAFDAAGVALSIYAGAVRRAQVDAQVCASAVERVVIRERLVADEEDCARRLRVACHAAPASRSWLGSGLAFVSGVGAGAGASLHEMATGVGTPWWTVQAWRSVATGDLTAREWAAKQDIATERAGQLWRSLRTDPLVTSWQMVRDAVNAPLWSDDPGRALGLLAPEAALAAMTGTGGFAAAKGAVNRFRLRLPVEPAFDLTGPRYLRPTVGQTEELRKLVNEYGSENLAAYLSKVNPRYADGPLWSQNCGPCSRAFADVYQGVETRVAPGDRDQGEQAEMFRWAQTSPTTWAVPTTTTPREFATAAWAEIDTAAALLPDRSVLIIGVEWADGVEGSAGGHWFNALRRDGELMWVDAQSGDYGPWPPPFEEVTGFDVIYRSGQREAWQELRIGG